MTRKLLAFFPRPYFRLEVLSSSVLRFFSTPSIDGKQEGLVESRLRIESGCGSRVDVAASQAGHRLIKEIFDHASRQSDFENSEFIFLKSVVKLVRTKNFVLVDNILQELATRRAYLTPKLISCLVRAYEEAERPDKVEEVYYKFLELNLKPSSKDIERILEILVCNDGYLKPAYKLFKIARSLGAAMSVRSYKILMRSFSVKKRLSIACKLFGEMPKRGILPDVESYRILIQGLCRRNQVNGAVGLLQDMYNKGFVPDSLIYTTLLNSLCRKKKLREAYKLLCRMKYKGCTPDIMHYNTVLIGFVREGRAADACKIIDDMKTNGIVPNVVSYRTLTGGLCDQGKLEEAMHYTEEMLSKGLSLHFSVQHRLIRRLCDVGKTEEACKVALTLLKHGEALCGDTWAVLVPMCEGEGWDSVEEGVDEAMMVELAEDTRIVDAGGLLEKYLREHTQVRSSTR